MTLQDLKSEITHWALTRYKFINLSIGTAALLVYECIGRPLYRPYIYSRDLYDFHVADTLGNSLGTMAAVFILVGLFSHSRAQGDFLIKISTVSIVLYELAHPLLGKPIDGWDMVATILSGALCYLLFHAIFKTSNS